MFKKVVSAIMVAAMVGTMVAPVSVSAKDGGKTIELWTCWTEGADTEKASQEMIQKWEEETGNTVNQTNFTYDMLHEKILTAAAGGNVPVSHAKPLIVLDDPFAALDRNTEEEIFRELKAMSKDRIILLISHRLYLFDQTDQVIWMENGQTQTGTHEKMLQIVPEYANLCKVWKEGADHA